MSRLLRRPDETNGSGHGGKLEVYVIDKKPQDKKIFKHEFGTSNFISVKELVTLICRERGILPNHSALFGICMLHESGHSYFPYSKILTAEAFRKKTLYFRLQFKAVDCTTLRKEDKKAFEYYLLQCRHDFVYGRFRKNLSKMGHHNKKQEMLLRMVILEMLLQSEDEAAMPTKDRTSQLQQLFRKRNAFSIEAILEKYVDEKDEVKKCKKIIEKSLDMFKNVKEPEFDFLREIEFLPDYEKETIDNIFKVYSVNDIAAQDDVWITVHPREGVSRVRLVDEKYKKTDERFQFENIENLTIKHFEDNHQYQLIMGIRGKLPEVLCSDSEAILECLCSWIDGYYRLLVDQYVSLLPLPGDPTKDPTKEPTIKTSRYTNIHGPIEHSISEKLLESYQCKEGEFLIREHRRSYGEFVLTMLSASGFKHYEIKCQSDDQGPKYFIEKRISFPSIEQLVKYYQENTDPNCLTLKRNMKPAAPMPFLSERKSASFITKPTPSLHWSEVAWIRSETLIKDTTSKAENITKGRFGEVSLCKQRRDLYAQSVIVRKFKADEISKVAFERIAKYYKIMQNRLIVRLTGLSSPEDNIKLMAFEFMEFGPLDEYLKQNRDSIRYRSILKYMIDIAEAMMYLEVDMKVVHGNLKLHNVLLMDSDNIKVSDACFDWVMQQQGLLPMASILSSANWRAPEVISGGQLSHSSDVWSFGIALWDIMSLSTPIGNVEKEKLLESLQSDARSQDTLLPHCSDEIKEILADCWKDEPTQRIHFQEICYRLRRYKQGVSDHLLERNYYNWHRIEEAEREEIRLQRVKRAQFLSSQLGPSSLSLSGSSDNLSSSNSSGSSGSKSYRFVAENRLTDTSGESASSKSSLGLFGSTETINRSKFASDLRQGGTESISRFDVEMKDLSSEIEARPSIGESKLNIHPMVHAREVHEDKMETDFTQTSGTQSLSNLKEIVEDVSGKESISRRASEEGASSTYSRSASEEPNEDYVTPDVMEVANVLASMAHHHGSDQKRRNPNQLDIEGQKIPKIIRQDRQMPQLRKAPLVPISITMAIRMGLNPPVLSSADKQYDSAYESASGSVLGSSNSLARQAVLMPMMKPPAAAAKASEDSTTYKTMDEMQHSFERKKRSRSISEEANKMHKKAAKRALDGPNPFNLGFAVPKNFLIKKKEPTPAPPKNQPPVDASKYFSDLMVPSALNGNISDLSSQKDVITQKRQENSDAEQFEDQGYKSWSEIQQLDEKMSYLKTASPQSTQQPATSTVLQAAADPNAIQAAINAYLTQLVSQGHSLVAGSPVFIPQVAMNANLNQAAALPQLLHLIQAQQKLGQPGSSSSQTIQPNRQIDASLQISPAYLQTLLAIMATKNLIASSANSNQQFTQTIAAPTISESPYVVSASSSLIATTTVPSSAVSSTQTSQDQYKKVLDIKPKIAPNTIDLTGIDHVAVLPTVSTTSNNHDKPQLLQVPQGNPSIPQNSLRSLFDNKSTAPRPIFMKSSQPMQPSLIDSSMQRPRTVLPKPAPAPHPIRLQPLILPKSLPDQTEQRKDLKMPSNQILQTSNATRIYTDAPLANNPVPSSRIKVEPTSPSAIYPKPGRDYSRAMYRTLSPSSMPLSPSQMKQRRLSVDEVRGFSEKLSQVQKRRQSEENSNILAQLGNVNVFNNNDLNFEKKLGEGQFGEVWKAVLRCKGKSGNITQYPVAVKKLKNTEEQSYEQFKNEVKQLASLDNDYVVKLIGVSIDSKGEAEGPWIITDLMPFGNLNQFIVNHRQTLTEETLLRFAVQIAYGMEFLQSRSIVHRDLAARNVLVESRDRVKVSDFGLSRMFGDNKDYYRGKTPSLLPIRWYSLESIRDSVFTSKSDVWSYGVTLWEVFLLWGSKLEYANPYEGMNGSEILEFIEKGNRLTKPERCKDELWAIILGCWNEKPDNRPSFYLLSYEILHNPNLNIGLQTT